MTTKQLKPFDLEAAKAGKSICFPCGEPLRFIGVHSEGDIVFERENGVIGTYAPAHFRMAPTKRTVWLNKDCDGAWHEHATQESATRYANEHKTFGRYFAIAVPVEIEE
jgi:hypothetical protein